MTSFRWRTTGLLAVTLAAATVMLVACAGDSPINIDGGGPPPSPTPVSFSATVIPALQSKTCTQASCHGSTNIALNGGIHMDPADVSGTYTTLTTVPGNDTVVVVNTANVTSSELLTKPDSGSSGVTHTGGKLWNTGDASYKKVKAWIAQGAPNN